MVSQKLGGGFAGLNPRILNDAQPKQRCPGKEVAQALVFRRLDFLFWSRECLRWFGWHRRRRHVHGGGFADFYTVMFVGDDDVRGAVADLPTGSSFAVAIFDFYITKVGLNFSIASARVDTETGPVG